MYEWGKGNEEKEQGLTRNERNRKGIRENVG
jgi:hypothetical protein